MGFEIRKKKKFKRGKEFAMRMKKVYEKAKVVLKKSQEEIRKYTNRKKSKVVEYRVGNWVLFSIKDLKF